MRIALRPPIAWKLGEEFDRSCRRSRSRYPGAEWMPVMDVIENGEEYVVGSRRPGSTRRS